MSGPKRDHPVATEIKLHKTSRVMDLAFSDGAKFHLPCEFLRVLSPSAEVRGHGSGQEVLQAGKREVNIERIEPVGNYAIRPVFTDGHDSGIYSWDLLYEFGKNREALWQQYLSRLRQAGLSRDGRRVFEIKAVPASAPLGKRESLG